jgi:cytochrome c biogenesis factor
VAIGSSWHGDFYTILNNGEGDTAVSLTFIEMPLMRWLWVGGGVSGVGVIVALWPVGRKKRTGEQALGQFTAGKLTRQSRECAAPQTTKRAA